MISQKKVAVLIAALLVPVLLIVASAALAQEPVYIQKSDSPDPVYAGEELFYEIFITPPEPGLWWITDTLPPEVTYISDTLEPIPVPGFPIVITEGCQLVGNELGCMLYAEWGPRSFQIKTRVAPDAVAALDTGTVVANNVAWLAYYDPVQGPEEPGPFAAEGTFIEDLADLAVIKMSKPDTHVQAGELFTYTIFVENLGPSYARNVSIRDEILSSGAFTVTEVLGDPNREDACYVAPDGGIPEGPGETIECDLVDPLEPKDIVGRGRWVIQVVLSANETQDVNNLVNVFSGDPDGPEGPGMPTADPDLSNNLAEDFIYVTDVADLSISKGLDWCDEPGGECVAGGVASFSISVYNNGPSTAENVVVEDLLPSGVTVVGVSGDGACTTGIPGDPFAPLTCNLGSFAPLERKSFDVEVRIDPDYVDAELPDDYRELENDAVVYSDIFDPDNDNNRAHVILEVYTWSDLFMFKWGSGPPWDPDHAVAGEELEYHVRVRNLGPSTAHNFHFVDPLPPEVTFLDYSIEQGTGTCFYHDPLPFPFSGPGVHCYLDDIRPGGVNVVHLQVIVNPDVSVGFCNAIPEGAWFADSYVEVMEGSELVWCAEVDSQADLSIEKTSEPPKIYPGEQKVYHIEVTNHGPSDAPGVMVTDTLPFELHYQIDTDNCDLVSPGPPEVLECDLGTIPAGDSAQFDIHALVAPGYAIAAPVEITNTAQVSMTTDLVLDPDLANNTDTATNLILPPDVADLEIHKDYECEEEVLIDPPGPQPDFWACVAGAGIIFDLDVHNNGPSTAENVVLEDLLPAGVTVYDVCIDSACLWDEPNGDGVACNTGIPGNPDAPLTCNLGTMDVSEWVYVEIYAGIDPDYVDPVLPWDVRAMENDALVYSDHFDPYNDNDRHSVVLPVGTLSDVSMWKTGPDDAMAGEEMSYHIRVRNLGPSTLRNFHFVDDLPEEVSYLGYEIEQGGGYCIYPWPYAGEHGAHCYLDDISPGGLRVVHLRVLVNPDVLDGTFIDNYIDGWFADSGHDVLGPPDWRSWDTEVINEADLSIWKEADPWKVYAGEQIRYDIEVTNNGPGVAYDVFVTDTLPISVTYELATIEDCYPLDGQVECYFEGIAPGETRAFSIFARVDPGAELGTISNEVIVWSEWTYDPIDYNDRDTAPIYIQGKADLKLTKYGKPDGEVRAGEELIYTVIVDNLGPSYAHEVELRDILASNGEFDLLSVTSDPVADCDPTSGTYTNTLELTCSLSDTLDVMTPGESGRWIVTVVVEAAEPQSINNVAHVVSTDLDLDPSNNQAIAEHNITAVADLEISKTAWGEVPVGCYGETDLRPNEVAAGGTVTYTLTVTNTGPSTAENVVVRDQPLPSLLEIDLQSIEPSQGNCLTANIGPPDYLLTCNLGTLGPDLTATVDFTATVPSWVPEGTLLVNDALVYSDMFDDDTGNSIVSNHTIVSTWADLEAEKTQDPEMAVFGMDVTYSITVTNLGPNDAYGVIVSDTMPVTMTNVTVECCASSDGECDVVGCEVPTCPQGECPSPDVGLYAQADIPAGEWVIYTVTGTGGQWPCEPITNTVEVIAPQSLVHPLEDIDPCDENNVAWAVNDAICDFGFFHFVPLALKEYPGPGSTP